MLVTPEGMTTDWSEVQYASRFCGIAVRVPGSLTWRSLVANDDWSVVMVVTPSGNTSADSEVQLRNIRPLNCVTVSGITMAFRLAIPLATEASADTLSPTMISVTPGLPSV